MQDETSQFKIFEKNSDMIVSKVFRGIIQIIYETHTNNTENETDIHLKEKHNLN